MRGLSSLSLGCSSALMFAHSSSIASSMWKIFPVKTRKTEIIMVLDSCNLEVETMTGYFSLLPPPKGCFCLNKKLLMELEIWGAGLSF